MFAYIFVEEGTVLMFETEYQKATSLLLYMAIS